MATRTSATRTEFWLLFSLFFSRLGLDELLALFLVAFQHNTDDTLTLSV